MHAHVEHWWKVLGELLLEKLAKQLKSIPGSVPNQSNMQTLRPSMYVSPAASKSRFQIKTLQLVGQSSRVGSGSNHHLWTCPNLRRTLAFLHCSKGCLYALEVYLDLGHVQGFETTVAMVLSCTWWTTGRGQWPPQHEIWKYYQSTSKVHANVLQNLIVRLWVSLPTAAPHIDMSPPP